MLRRTDVTLMTQRPNNHSVFMQAKSLLSMVYIWYCGTMLKVTDLSCLVGACTEAVCAMEHVFFINRNDVILCRYRAKIEKIEGSKITVFFIDFGNVSWSHTVTSNRLQSETCSHECQSQRPGRGHKTFYTLNSSEHEIYPAHKC